MSLANKLTERGFIHQFSAATLQEIVDGEKRTIYHGVDPTADSIHAGNFVIWMMLRHLVNDGHKVILLIGGGTGMIGDPKPDMERSLTSPEVVAERVEKLRIQAKLLLGSENVIFVNNYDWLGNLNLIDFLRDTGKHFTVNELIKKEAIANRLNSENGISYTEFAYPILQAFDYLTLHEKYGCDLQVGGSDQWGNMIAGVDLVRKKTGHSVNILTVPLVVDKSTGKKFGKSEGNAVWLDAEKTSPYQFYQFWFNVSDEDVVGYLKLFTFLPLDEITQITREFEMNPGQRSAQKTLAFNVTKIVHGEIAATAAQNVSEILFDGRSLETLSSLEKDMLLNNAPVLKVTPGLLLVDTLVETGLASSKREARTFIESGAIVLAGEKITDINTTVTNEHFTSGIVFLRRGKKHLHILILQD